METGVAIRLRYIDGRRSAGCRGRALSQSFMTTMWLIRKIGVRRNIAAGISGGNKWMLEGGLDSGSSVSSVYCISDHKNDTTKIRPVGQRLKETKSIVFKWLIASLLTWAKKRNRGAADRVLA